ncbi:hypothetical protein GGX14DRAFT_390887 [Mycena pura]|uniref:Uncharacterized protein n=1 Tax=Mycena pura TaxID=153505 RepID=A0AAD6VLW3_9AGAR|nr:hypothetical protein GGX14DRAFT_390887 [Mycena pura]
MKRGVQLLRRSSSTTTHVSDSEPEPEAQRRRVDRSVSPTPNSATTSRAPLAPIHNNVQPRRHGARPQKRSKDSSEDRFRALENRLQAVEKKLEECVEQTLVQSPFSPPGVSPAPDTSITLENDSTIARLLKESFRELKQEDPRLYLLDTPVRQGGMTRRLGYRTE